MSIYRNLFNMKIKQRKLNFQGFQLNEIEKSSYQEGIYADTPQNRKLGRVGMSYAQYENFKNKNKEENREVILNEEKEESHIDNTLIEEYNEEIPKPNVEERWNAYGLFCNMVASGVTKSLVAFGTGGVGKTYTLMQELKSLGLKEYDDDSHDINYPQDFDYVKITGSASGSAVYKALFEYNGKLLIFDDCDSVLRDQSAVNFLKGALDSTGDGSISYSSSVQLKTDKSEGAALTSTGITLVPNRFKFKGQVIFISNLPPEEIPQPLIDSRCLSINLSMTKEETIERLEKIMPKMDILDAKGRSLRASKEDKRMALDFLNRYKDKIREGKLNARTLGNIVKIIHSSDGKNNWESAALALLSN